MNDWDVESSERKRMGFRRTKNTARYSRIQLDGAKGEKDEGSELCHQVLELGRNHRFIHFQFLADGCTCVS